MTSPQRDPDAVQRHLDTMIQQHLSAFAISSPTEIPIHQPKPAPRVRARTEAPKAESPKAERSKVETNGSTKPLPHQKVTISSNQSSTTELEKEDMKMESTSSDMDKELAAVREEPQRKTAVLAKDDGNLIDFSPPKRRSSRSPPPRGRAGPSVEPRNLDALLDRAIEATAPPLFATKSDEKQTDKSQMTSSSWRAPPEPYSNNGTKSKDDTESPPLRGVKAPPSSPVATLEEEAAKTRPAMTFTKPANFGASPLSVLQGSVARNRPSQENAKPLRPTHPAGTTTNKDETKRPQSSHQESNGLLDRQDVNTSGLHFKAWPLPEKRETNTTGIRRVFIRNLPATSTPFTILNLITHGPIEQIVYKPSTTTAIVYFINPEDCKAFYDANCNGLLLKGAPERFAFVHLAPEADPLSGKLKELLAAGATRCIRAVGIDKDWQVANLRAYAQARQKKLETLDIATSSTGSRIANFRFCSIQDAVRFRGQIERDDDWEHCNVTYSTDPCGKDKS